MERTQILTAADAQRGAALLMAAALALGGALLLLTVWLTWPGAAGAAVNTAPPASPVKLVFIHHSTGEAWLADGHGGLGKALRDDGFFVSDTNYEWGPDAIGSTTDIGHWYTWFRDPATSPAAMTALYAESDTHCDYSRLATDPGGDNEVVLFKSCFPNSDLYGSATALPTPIGSDPIKGQGAGGSDYTVANAKGIYVDLLPYFAAHQEKLFVAIVAPPVQRPFRAANGRAMANWLVNDWLTGYGYNNVVVFDFYTTLTSRRSGGNDVGLAGGNHHRIWNGAVQHLSGGGVNHLVYPTAADNDHPTAGGDRKATAELIPMLNNAYNTWKSIPGSDTLGPQTFAPRSAAVRRGRTATLYYRVTDDQSASAVVVVRVRTRGGTLKKTLTLGLQGAGTLRQARFTCSLRAGTYRFTVEARDLTGNAAQAPLGHNTLTVR